MPLYTKFIKDIFTKKEKYIDNENIVMGGNCSVVIQRKMPKKFKDPGSMTIPCTIGNESVGKALIDLGAIINLINHKLYKVVEDVLVKVCHFTFPVDFVIMDIEEDAGISFILGRPFMLTANCIVDMGNDNLEMNVDDQKVTFNLFEAIKYLGEDRRCFKVEEVDKEDIVALQTTQTSLEKALINVVDCLTSEEEKDLRACLEDLDREENILAGGGPILKN